MCIRDRFEGLGDSYSVYYTKEEYESMMASTSGTYFGIGAVLSQDVKTMQVSILHVYENTPAEKAGLKDGDVICLLYTSLLLLGHGHIILPVDCPFPDGVVFWAVF